MASVAHPPVHRGSTLRNQGPGPIVVAEIPDPPARIWPRTSTLGLSTARPTRFFFFFFPVVSCSAGSQAGSPRRGSMRRGPASLYVRASDVTSPPHNCRGRRCLDVAGMGRGVDGRLRRVHARTYSLSLPPPTYYLLRWLRERRREGTATATCARGRGRTAFGAAGAAASPREIFVFSARCASMDGAAGVALVRTPVAVPVGRRPSDN